MLYVLTLVQRDTDYIVNEMSMLPDDQSILFQLHEREQQ